MQTVLSTPTFLSDALRAGMSDDEVEAVVDVIAANPMAGDLIVGTGGARKLRHRRKGTGKSGGYRTIHYFAGRDVPVFLLAVYGKGDKDNLTNAERNEMSKILSTLAADYRSKRRMK
jgi:hypothetical protein